MHGWRFHVYNSFRELGGQILLFSLSFLPSLLSLPIPFSVFYRFPLLWEFVSLLVLCRRVNNEISRLEKFTSDSRATRRCLMLLAFNLCRILSCLINRISARTVITSSTVAHPQLCNLPWFDIFRRKSISRHCAVSLYEMLSWEIHKLNPLSFNYVCVKLKKLLTVILCYYQRLGILTY